MNRLKMICILALALCLIGCQAKMDGMPNPNHELDSMEQLTNELNFACIKPEGNVTDESFVFIDGQPEIGEYSFKVDGTQCTLRYADCDYTTDISGIYVEDHTLFDTEQDVTYYVENDDVKGCRWFTLDGQYTFVVEDKGEWDNEKFESLLQQFRTMKPARWNSKVAYEDYLKLCGDYMAYDNIQATVFIHLNKVEVIAFIQQVDGILIWDADCELIDDKLAYEEATVTKNENETKEESGYIQIVDGCLDFSNVECKEFKGVVFNPVN